MINRKKVTDLYLTEKYKQADLARTFGTSKQRIQQILLADLGQRQIDTIKMNYYKKTDEEIKVFNRQRVGRLLKETAKDRWNWNYLRCIDCGRTDRRYQGHGLCEACYSKNLYNTSEKRKESQKKYAYEWKENNPEKIREINRKAAKVYHRKNRDEINRISRYRYKNDETFKELRKLRNMKSRYKKLGNKEKYIETEKKIKKLL